MQVKRIPMTHGMEIEQFRQQVPRQIMTDEYDDYWGRWHCDYSDVYETNIGPAKYVNTLIEEFLETARQYNNPPWKWRTGMNNLSAGSHIHSHLEKMDTMERSVKAWTIAYNTFIDTSILLAPFFCHNWQYGFRDGEYYGSDLAIKNYADVNTKRKTQDSIRTHYELSRGDGQFHSVTFKGERDEKPLTIELRMSDSHPTFALTGIALMRRIIKRCLERDLSVKIRDRANLRHIYDNMYDLPSNNNLLGVMQTLPVDFERGIPGISDDVSTVWECLDEILQEYLPEPRSVQRNVVDLVRASGKLAEMREFDPFIEPVQEIPDPHSLHPAPWYLDDPEFEWPIDAASEIDRLAEERFT